MAQRSPGQIVPNLLWPSAEMLSRNNRTSFSAHSQASFSRARRAANDLERTLGTNTRTTDHPECLYRITADLPKPESPRGVLGLSSGTHRAGRSFPLPASSATATVTHATVRGTQVEASRHLQNGFPAITSSPGLGAQQKKKWRPHCRHPSCLRPASYAGSTDSEPVFCEKHKTRGQLNIVHPNRGECESVGCGRVSAYASTADTRARFCHLHKEDGMVKVRDRVGTRCEEATCIKQASFAMEGDRYPKFCKDHRHGDMINIRNHRCAAPGCLRGASFAPTGSQRGQFCSEHKADDMVNTRTRRNNRCVVPGCTRGDPNCVMEGQQMPKLSASHRGEGVRPRQHPTNGNNSGNDGGGRIGRTCHQRHLNRNSIDYVEGATLELIRLRAGGATSPPTLSPTPSALQANGDIGIIGRKGFGKQTFPSRSGFAQARGFLVEGNGMAGGSLDMTSPNRASASAPAPAVAMVDVAIGLELGAERSRGQGAEEQERGGAAEAVDKKEGHIIISVSTPNPKRWEGKEEEGKGDEPETLKNRKNATTGHSTATHSDTQPPGYTPTPFYFTLVNALTGKRKR